MIGPFSSAGRAPSISEGGPLFNPKRGSLKLLKISLVKWVIIYRYLGFKNLTLLI